MIKQLYLPALCSLDDSGQGQSGGIIRLGGGKRIFPGGGREEKTHRKKSGI